MEGKEGEVPYLCDPTNTSHLKRIQMSDAASVLPQHGNTVTLPDYTLLLLCILITQPSQCLEFPSSITTATTTETEKKKKIAPGLWKGIQNEISHPCASAASAPAGFRFARVCL